MYNRYRQQPKCMGSALSVVEHNAERMKTVRKEKLETIALTNIHIDDLFWNKYRKLVTQKILPYQWKALNDQIEDAEPSHCIANFEIAAGLKKGEFKGWVFQDTDLAKWLEAAAYTLSYEKNEELEGLIDAAVDLVEKAQEENGYLNTYFSLQAPGKQFCNLREGHELYTAGHFMEAAVAYYKVTGKEKLLNIMRKNADLICRVFHTPRYANAVPGHEEIELALVKMAEVTGEERYFQMAEEFVERRGTEPNYLVRESTLEDYVDVWHDPNPYKKAYGQNDVPVREQKTAEGHAVRATYLYCAMADIAAATKDETLLAACEILYNNIVEKRMYITGGIGSCGTLERFTTDYDLPNDTNYSESCASIGLALFCRRMAQITGDAKYTDTMELALMNTVLAGIAMDGKSFFYVNPLEVWPANCLPDTDKNHIKPVRQKWFGCACCPPNIARTLASLGEYVCFVESNGIWLNLFTAGRIETEIAGKKAELLIETNFPFEGNIKIVFCAEEAAKGSIRLRVPAYAQNPQFFIDGKEIFPEIEKGYAVWNAQWKNQTIEYRFEMPPRFVYANPQVRADAGKTAVMKGPLVYCLEQADNGENLASLYADTRSPMEEMFDANTLEGIVRIKAKGKKIKNEKSEQPLYGWERPKLQEAELTFVPYCNWGNRGPGEMAVWTKILQL